MFDNFKHTLNKHINEAKHDFNKHVNDIKHDFGLKSDANHALTDLHEDVRYQWNNFKDHATETIHSALALKDTTLKVIDDFFDTSNDSLHS